MSDTLTKNERNALRSALATGGHIRFETHRQVGTTIKAVEGVTVVTQTTYDLQITMRARGWIERVREPYVFKLTGDGKARAKRIRPLKEV